MILSGSSSTIDFSKMEFIPECDREFPVTCYEYDLCERIEPWHWHDQFEAALVEGGEAFLCIEGCEYSLRSGEGYFINSVRAYGGVIEDECAALMGSFFGDKRQ